MAKSKQNRVMDLPASAGKATHDDPQVMEQQQQNQQDLQAGDNPPDETSRSEREQRIREAAYAAAERRGFEPGREVDDWLEAEQQVEQNGQARQQS